MQTTRKHNLLALAVLGLFLIGGNAEAQEVPMAKDLIFGNFFDASGDGKTSKSFDDFSQCIGDWAKSRSSRATHEIKEIDGKKVAIIGVARGPVFVAIDAGNGDYKTQYVNTIAGRTISGGAMQNCA